jgi:adenosylmethionine-8-amino-7-oxononanoate aminotransferase
MASADLPAHPDRDELEALARRHLWLHFTRLGDFQQHDVPIMVRGVGCELWDANGQRYLDALAGLFVVQAGHGRVELAEAGARQARELAYFPLWSHAHEPAIRLAARLAELAPGDLDRVFFTSGGSESVESAWKLARSYFRAIGQSERRKVIARRGAYHGTTLGALSITGVTALREPFEPLVPGVSHVATTNRFRCDHCAGEAACTLACADEIEAAILAAGPDTVCAVVLEPVQNAGGCIPPAPGYFVRVREICDRHGVLLVSDEVICAFGRLGTMFGCERYGYLPDIVTTAKGITSGYAPLGAVIAREHLVRPFLEGTTTFAHGLTFAGHPASCAVALANLDVFAEEDLVGNVAACEAGLVERLEGLQEDLPIVGDVRGAGYFHALELVPEAGHPARFTPQEAEALIRGLVAPRLFDEGLVCRADNRGDPVIQLSPPLIAGPDELDEIESILRKVLGEAQERLRSVTA